MDQISTSINHTKSTVQDTSDIVARKFVLCITAKDELYGIEASGFTIRKIGSIGGLDIISTYSESERPDAVIFFGEEVNEIYINQLQYASLICSNFDIPLISIIRNLEFKSPEITAKYKSIVLKNGADDCYTKKDIDVEQFGSWIEFLALYKKVSKRKPDQGIEPGEFKIDPYKRLTDIIISALALVVLAPVFLLIALIIVLESRGPVIYSSKRAGFGYKIFDFYKFRSMRTGAEKELKDLAKFNQYQQENKEAIFIKIKDDPRVTRFGQFLRNTSLDELPQLVNVLIGDMSLVGNRPLPLYEADKLTKDGTAWRFLAPAGMTGLWQINKRGKAEMSLDERISLDVIYARKYSPQLDLKILFSTLPAMIQKEKV